MIFTIQVAEHDSVGLVAALKSESARVLKEELKLKRWPPGMSETLSQTFSYALSLTKSGTCGEAPFNVVIDGRIPDEGVDETPTISVGVSGK